MNSKYLPTRTIDTADSASSTDPLENLSKVPRVIDEFYEELPKLYAEFLRFHRVALKSKIPYDAEVIRVIETRTVANPTATTGKPWYRRLFRKSEPAEVTLVTESRVACWPASWVATTNQAIPVIKIYLEVSDGTAYAYDARNKVAVALDRKLLLQLTYDEAGQLVQSALNKRQFMIDTQEDISKLAKHKDRWRIIDPRSLADE